MINTVIQNVSAYTEQVDESKIIAWIDETLRDRIQETEVSIRIVDEAEMTHFNSTFRNKEAPTNVLSFPFENAPDDTHPILGDILICAPVVAKEAIAQKKSYEAHFAHMVIHGCLHCLGYDHDNPDAADTMEAIEIDLLARFNFSNPYGD